MIIHIDMDAYYASVEIRDNPELVGKPVVVGGSPTGRGVIAAASYEARKFGVYSAMPASQAIRKCPGAVFVKPRMEHYAKISKQIRAIFADYTSLVEPLALDEAFLDVTGCQRLLGNAANIAVQIRTRILNELGLIASAGVAPNKYLAKLASDLEKPNGLVVVDPDTVQQFLDPLPISRVWGVGKKTQEKFKKIGVTTIANLRQISMSTLKPIFGVNSQHFWNLARGIDSRNVVPDRVAKSVSHETTFRADIYSKDAILAWASELTDQVGRRLRRYQITGKTIQVKLRYSNFQTITRAMTLPRPTDITEDIRVVAHDLINRVEFGGRGIRLLGVGVNNLTRGGMVQGMLFDQAERKQAKRIDATTDKIKEKFGSHAVLRGTSLEHEIRHRPDPRVNDD